LILFWDCRQSVRGASDRRVASDGVWSGTAACDYYDTGDVHCRHLPRSRSSRTSRRLYHV